MKITNYGHSCIGVRTAGHDLLFDPFVSGNPLASALDAGHIPVTEVLVTHGHGDHVLDAEAVAKRANATLISNYEVAGWFSKKGVQKTVGLNLGGGTTIGDLRVKYVNAIHSSEMPDGSYGGNPGGFVVTGPEGSFHHAGDTALTMDMQLLKRFDLKFACLPVGDHFTMGVDDAIIAAQFMGVQKVIGIHYNTFPPIAIDTEKAKAAFSKAGLELLLPPIGSTIEIN